MNIGKTNFEYIWNNLTLRKEAANIHTTCSLCGSTKYRIPIYLNIVVAEKAKSTKSKTYARKIFKSSVSAVVTLHYQKCLGESLAMFLEARIVTLQNACVLTCFYTPFTVIEFVKSFEL